MFRVSDFNLHHSPADCARDIGPGTWQNRNGDLDQLRSSVDGLQYHPAAARNGTSGIGGALQRLMGADRALARTNVAQRSIYMQAVYLRMPATFGPVVLSLSDG